MKPLFRIFLAFSFLATGLSLLASDNPACATNGAGLAIDIEGVGRELSLVYKIKSYETTDSIINLSLAHDLDAVFGAGNYKVQGGPILWAGFDGAPLSNNFDGSGNQSIITGGGLPAGDSLVIKINVAIETIADLGSGLYSLQTTVS